MTRQNNTLYVVLFFLFLAGCAKNTALSHIPLKTDENPRKIAVFLDGTANDEASHTNISKLHKLTSLQENTNISTTYIKGVGTNGKFLGMAMGWGIGHDVREAYRYLGENYNPKQNDELYIFGFSRGAYAARILAALVHVAGIPDLRTIPENKRNSRVKDIYSAYKSKKSIEERRKDVMAVTGSMPTSVKVEFLGIWDTVEALGWPDYEEDIVAPNPRYADQLCNIKKAAHAVSIDDDRARIFTPILLTRNHLVEQCTDSKELDIDNIVDEVWFSGAHSDIGGGYKDTDIGGVSLNWMIKHLSPYSLLPKDTKVYADPYGETHDPESGLFGLIYHRRNRNLPAYTNGADYNNGRLKIHRSVLDRLAKTSVKWHESKWFNSEKYKKCFQSSQSGLEYIEGENCFDVIEY